MHPQASISVYTQNKNKPQLAASRLQHHPITRSRGTPYDAAQSCRFYAVRATRTAAVSTAENLGERVHKERLEDCGSRVGD